jgi:hypothetical protein
MIDGRGFPHPLRLVNQVKISLCLFTCFDAFSKKPIHTALRSKLFDDDAFSFSLKLFLSVNGYRSLAAFRFHTMSTTATLTDAAGPATELSSINPESGADEIGGRVGDRTLRDHAAPENARGQAERWSYPRNNVGIKKTSKKVTSNK